MPHINRLYFWFRNYLGKHLPKIYNFCENRKSVIKFFFAGCFAGGTDLILLFIFHGVFKWPLVLSTSLAFVASFLVSFTLQKFWTFRNFTQGKAVGQFILYILNAFVGLNLNAYFMHLLVNRHHVWYILAQVIVSVSIGVYNFIIYKSIVFKTEKNENKREQKTLGTSTGDLA
jgi:putative flippase GtrA